MADTAAPKVALELADRFEEHEGPVALGGVQALVRVLLDQARLDRTLGRRVGTLVSGYRGSPLGGFDQQLARNRALLEHHDIHFLEGLNEDLAATAVMGSQIARAFPRPRFDGVRGMWFGKGPGVDRTGDAFRHGNLTGVDPLGGVLVAAGDDPGCKSSSLPSASELAFFDLQMPVLQPGSVAEVVELGSWGFELSRYSGLWTAMKIVTNVADSYTTVELAGAPVDVVRPELVFDGVAWRPTLDHRHFPPYNLGQERELAERRIVAAHVFAAANGLYEVPVATPDDRIGIVASGKTYHDLREALARLRLDDERLHHLGIRLFRPKLIFPLDGDQLASFASGLTDVLVIEEKRAFLELQLRDLLYGRADAPRVHGKRTADGAPLLPAHGELDADAVAEALRVQLERWIPELHLEPPAGRIRIPITVTEADGRSPFYCSGCPHNRSTVVPDGSIAAAGIGCHGMAMLHDPSTLTSTHMGGEGMQWVGAAPFTETEHIFQNIGDGTFFHSGSLAVRQAVAAGATMTYKILWNSAVAMTGGQDVHGARSVGDLVDLLLAEAWARSPSSPGSRAGTAGSVAGASS